MKSAEVRQKFLNFFADKGHTIVPSSSLVPGNDPTLLFTNSGMVQFKDVFLGIDKRPYTRATTAQRCVRAGGKHNDLENVGYTARHHTFFEMLGNFSFGDYFKRDAIHYAWDFLTNVIKLPKAKLWVTVYAEDQEAYDIWVSEIGVDPNRISRIGDNKGARYASDNFWQMGDTGPCGPCTEIFYDHGEHIWGGPPGSPEEDGDRYIEIWNVVFMQFERSADGVMTPLPKPSVDTGMGLERLCAILQGVHSNYEIDTFQALIGKIAELAGMTTDLDNPSLRVIADHIRSCSFMIVDGVLPDNEGRGYVLRRIIRRAVRHGHKLGLDTLFFYKIVPTLVEQMGQAYPELAKAQVQVEAVLKREEELFAKTLANGMRLISEAISTLKAGDTIDGETAFRLYDTYGFPLDLTADIARERELKVDEAGFERALEEQRNKSREAGKFKVDMAGKLDVSGATDFHGYDNLIEPATIIALFHEGNAVQQLHAGQRGQVVLSNTPFYAESGGQIGDQGTLHLGTSTFKVHDTQKQGSTFIHDGVLESGTFVVGNTIQAEVDQERRQAIILNHSATHLMHAALRQVLGTHVEQKGSLVTAERLRFDFSQPEAVTAAQIAEVEAIVNAEVRRNVSTSAQVMSMEQALEAGAMALFGEKYGSEVRVLQIGFSTELCGGCHVSRTGDIGLFKIVSESGVAAGIRRIEAVTGANAIAWLNDTVSRLDQVARLLKSSSTDTPEKTEALVNKNRALEKEIDQLKGKLASQAGNSLLDQAETVEDIKVLAVNLGDVDSKALMDTLDQLKNKLGKAAIVLASVQGDKVGLIAGVTAAESKRVKAGDLVNHVASQVGGKGGGRPDMARAGGTNPANLASALSSVKAWVATQLG
jgi:alanyl-tRNA synthetase